MTEQERAQAVYDVMFNAMEKVVLAHTEGIKTGGELVGANASPIEMQLFETVFVGIECRQYFSKMDLLLRKYAETHNIPFKSITIKAKKMMDEMMIESVEKIINKINRN